MIAKIMEIIFKIKDYERLESNYCKVLDMVTGGRLSKPNYTIDTIRQAFNDYLGELDKDKIEALHTEYEKGRADVIQATEQWLANCWPQYCSNPNIIDAFKENVIKD